ncbi:MAG: hypothetical protein RIK87_21030 [Fuerstiella sp.]
MQRWLTGRQLLNKVPGRRLVVGVDKIKKRPGQKFLIVPAQHAAKGGIDPLEIAVGTGNSQQIQRHVKEPISLLLCFHSGRQILGRTDVAGDRSRRIANCRNN